MTWLIFLILKSCIRPWLQVAYGIDRVQREAARVRDVGRRSREGEGVVVRGRHAGAQRSWGDIGCDLVAWGFGQGFGPVRYGYGGSWPAWGVLLTASSQGKFDQQLIVRNSIIEQKCYGHRLCFPSRAMFNFESMCIVGSLCALQHWTVFGHIFVGCLFHA